MNKINRHVHDLFLAQDLDHCKFINGNGELIGLNMGLLQSEAAVFISHLGSLGVDNEFLPDANELAEAWRQF